MKWLLFGALILISPGLGAQPLTLEYASGDVWVGTPGHWTPETEGARLDSDQSIQLSAHSSAVVQAKGFQLNFTNPGDGLKTFSLAKATTQWSRTGPGQDVLATKLAKVIGQRTSGAPVTANMGVRAENQGSTGPKESPADALWADALDAIHTGATTRAVGVLKELMDYATGDRLFDAAVLLAQEYWAAHDGAGLEQWVPVALELPDLPTEDRQWILYFQSLDQMARGQDPQPRWSQIVQLSPETDLARSLTPPAN